MVEPVVRYTTLGLRLSTSYKRQQKDYLFINLSYITLFKACWVRNLTLINKVGCPLFRFVIRTRRTLFLSLKIYSILIIKILFSIPSSSVPIILYITSSIPTTAVGIHALDFLFFFFLLSPHPPVPTGHTVHIQRYQLVTFMCPSNPLQFKILYQFFKLRSHFEELE